MVVLAPLFWLQSMNTLPSRSDLVICQTASFGRRTCTARAMVRAHREISSDVRLPSSRLYRWMPLLPLVTGTLSSPATSRWSLTANATSAHWDNGTPGPGSRSNTTRSGFCGAPSALSCHCGTCSSSAAIWASQTITDGESAVG